jgi:hypothetical protein
MQVLVDGSQLVDTGQEPVIHAIDFGIVGRNDGLGEALLRVVEEPAGGQGV